MLYDCDNRVLQELQEEDLPPIKRPIAPGTRFFAQVGPLYDPEGLRMRPLERHESSEALLGGPNPMSIFSTFASGAAYILLTSN